MPENTSQNSAGEKTRPPVVVVLGHVDHGKTTLLDVIRKTKVASGESGGITQHIGAYQAQANGKTITFLDTPGHEAFTAIRSRGAKVADVAILVVAADESIKPQTKEAIGIIKEAGIPFIVAINKIDKPGANSQKVRQDLAGEEVLTEDWGGTVPAIETSARDGKGISELLDMVLLVSELEELKADPNSPAKGIIIESTLDKRRGHVATALVQGGTLHIGDWVAVGRVLGKVKSMEDFTGASVSEAGPSQPVSVLGWSAAPDIGREFFASKDKDSAEEHSLSGISLEPLFEFFRTPFKEPENQDKKTLNVIFRSDVTSSLEAIEASAKSIRSDKAGFRILDYGVGNVSEADVKTASAKGAIIFGFRVSVESSAKKLAEKEGIRIATFDIIYELIEAFRQAMAELIDPEIERNVNGTLKVLALFKKEGRAQILGGKVGSGKITRGSLVDVVRGGKPIKLGKITQLQQSKEDVGEVREGLECGLRIDVSQSDVEVKEGDVLECYEEEKITQSL